MPTHASALRIRAPTPAKGAPGRSLKVPHARRPAACAESSLLDFPRRALAGCLQVSHALMGIMKPVLDELKASMEHVGDVDVPGKGHLRTWRVSVGEA